MKKWLSLSLLVLVCACSKGFKEEIPPEQVSPEQYTVEDFHYVTGCWYEDFAKLRVRNFFGDVDEKQIFVARYIYGSKYINGGETFLIAKFNSSGTLVWETLKEEKGSYTYGVNPFHLSDNNIVMGYATRTEDSLSIANITPVIISVNNGSVKEVPVTTPFFYDKVSVFDDFFFCSLENREQYLSSFKEPYSIQVSNEGVILSKADEFNIPDDNAVWKDSNWYIQSNKESISKKYIIKGEKKDQEWEYPVELPPFDSFERTIEFVKDSVKIDYEGVLSTGETQKRSYTLSYLTGKPTVPVTIKFKDKTVSLLVGEKKQTEIIIEPEDTEIGELLYSSEDTKIASVDAKGIITAKSAGTTTITVMSKDGSYKASCSVVVSHFTEQITISTSGSVMNIGGFVTAVVSVRLSNYSGKTIQVKRFSVIDGNGKEIYGEDVNEALSNKSGIARSLQYRDVYMPTYKYTYTVDGKQYEVTLSE